MRIREAIEQMLEHDDDLALYCARQIKHFEGWTISDDEARHRLRKAVRGHSGRHFEIDWYPVLATVFVKHGVGDAVSPLIHQAFMDAEYRLRQELRANPMRTVGTRRRERGVG